MQIKTSELTGAALNWAVAKCEGVKYRHMVDHIGAGVNGSWWVRKSYSTDWSQGGPIIERIKGFLFKHWLESNREGQCQAEIHNYDGDWIAFGPTPLIAAMRCYVASKFGDSIEIPDQLL
jgi:hypothetical protein